MRLMSTQKIVSKAVPTFYFIGVTTTRSSIMKVFPRWMEALGRPEVVIEGVDLQIHDSAENYRQIVSQIKHDPNSLGALVTTHKLDLFTAAKEPGKPANRMFHFKPTGAIPPVTNSNFEVK